LFLESSNELESEGVSNPTKAGVRLSKVKRIIVRK
jgi:hypothetical protein